MAEGGVYCYVNMSHLSRLAFSTTPLAILESDGIYHDDISFKYSSSTHSYQQFVVTGEYSHKTEAFSLSPVSTWVSLTSWAWC